MGAIGAVSTAAGVLRRNPMIVLGVLLLAVVGSLATIGQVFGSLVTVVAVIVGFFLQPFFTAGVLGMAEEGIDGHTSVDTLVDEGKEKYLTLLGATVMYGVLLTAIGIAFGIVGVVVLVGGGVAASAAGGAGGVFGLGVGLGVISFVLVGILIFLALFYFLQFYRVAIVIEDTGPWEAFKRSYALVRRNLLSTLGYTLIAQLINLVVLVPTLWFQFVGASGFDPENAAGGAMVGNAVGGTTLASVTPELGVSVVLGTVVSSFLLTYQVAYYDELLPERTTDAASAEPTAR